MKVQNNEGTIVDADSYVSYTYAGSYLANRINLQTYTDEQIASALVLATSFVDNNFSFLGDKLTGETQSTQFPRTTTAGVPDSVKKAVCEYSIWFLQGFLMMLGMTPEEYFGDKYVEQPNEIKTYVEEHEQAVADGKKYVAISEKFMYDDNLFVLIA